MLSGTIGGNVRVAAETLIVKPGARIAGSLRYRARSASVAEGAEAGGVRVEVVGDRRPPGVLARVAGAVVAVTGLALLAAVLLAALPGRLDEAAGMMRRRPLPSLLAGLVMLVALPLAMVLVMATVVGIPLALVLLCSCSLPSCWRPPS